MSKPTQEDMKQFVAKVAERLRLRLSGVSLELMDMGLKPGKADIATPGVDVLLLVGWVIRPATQEMKDFTIRFGANIGKDTEAEAIDPLCEKITKSLIGAFYPDKQ